MIRVSVVIPTLNEEAGVRQTLEHVFAQTITPHELIVVDNGSTDHTVDIVSSFSGVKILHQTLRGVGNARNMGAHHSTGDVVWFVDTDCRPKRNHLERAMQLFEDARVGMVTGPADFERKHRMQLQRVYATLVRFFGTMFRGATAVGANLFVWRASFLRVGGFDTRGACMLEDVALAMAIVRKARQKVVYKHDLTMHTSRRRLDRDGVLRHMALLGLGTVGLFFGLRPCPKFDEHP